MATDENGDYIKGSQMSKNIISKRFGYKNKASFTVNWNTTEFVNNYEKIDWSKGKKEAGDESRKDSEPKASNNGGHKEKETCSGEERCESCGDKPGDNSKGYKIRTRPKQKEKRKRKGSRSRS